APVATELAQPSEVPLDIQRILAQQVRLEHERDAFHSGVAHFTQPVNVLVRVNLDERIVVIGSQPASAHVRDLQPAGRRVTIHCFLRAHRSFRRLKYGTKHGRSRRASQHRPACQLCLLAFVSHCNLALAVWLFSPRDGPPPVSPCASTEEGSSRFPSLVTKASKWLDLRNHSNCCATTRAAGSRVAI